MISTVTDLNEKFELLSKSLDDKIKGGDGKRHIVLCGGTGCLSAHSTEIMERFNALLKEIWDSKWVTNNGSFHKQLEKELAEYLKVPYISLFTNG